MTQTQGHDDVTTQALLESALQLAAQTPDLMAMYMGETETNLVILYEDAQARNDTKTMTIIDTLWHKLQQIQTVTTNQMVATTSVGIVVMALRIQRDEALHTASEAIKQVNRLAGLKGA